MRSAAAHISLLHLLAASLLRSEEKETRWSSIGGVVRRRGPLGLASRGGDAARPRWHSLLAMVRQRRDPLVVAPSRRRGPLVVAWRRRGLALVREERVWAG
jgi:hypothetical protein